MTCQTSNPNTSETDLFKLLQKLTPTRATVICMSNAVGLKTMLKCKSYVGNFPFR